jgi:hypothetical protein
MSEYVLRKKTYMNAGDKARDSNDGLTIHGVTGIQVIKNRRINSHQKSGGYDVVDIKIVSENMNGNKQHMNITLFGLRGAQL